MIVKSIKFIDNKVQVNLDRYSFFISKENYIENPLAIESDVSEEYVKKLLDYEMVIESKISMIKLLNKRALSEYEIFLKLKEKGISKEEVLNIIEDLKRSGLINDEYVAIISSESMLVKRKGKKEIEKVLKEKRIADEIITNIIEGIDETQYLDNFEKVKNKYLKMYEKRSFKVKEKMVRQKLEEYGYENELIYSASVENDKENEIEIAKSALLKIIKNKNFNLDNYENINKIKSKLVMKGFSYDIINRALEGVKNDEIN